MFLNPPFLNAYFCITHRKLYHIYFKFAIGKRKFVKKISIATHIYQNALNFA